MRKPGVLIAALTLALTAGAAILGFSARAGALENRVDQLERFSSSMGADMKRVLDSLARIEAHLEDDEAGRRRKGDDQ